MSYHVVPGWARALAASLAQAGEALQHALRQTALIRTRDYPSGSVEYEEYFPARAKSALDEIDRFLAAHYGFTDEEVEYILNYDLKYRMGRGAAHGNSPG